MLRPGDTLFLDTNVLLAATDRSRPRHHTARALIATGRSHGCRAALSGQIVREYLVVATRPTSANGLGLSPADAHRNVEQFARRLAFCDETEAVSMTLRGLVQMHGLQGTSVHDANVVATMRSHGMDTLVTQNVEDFRRYPEVRPITLDEAEALLNNVRSRTPGLDGGLFVVPDDLSAPLPEDVQRDFEQ